MTENDILKWVALISAIITGAQVVAMNLAHLVSALRKLLSAVRPLLRLFR